MKILNVITQKSGVPDNVDSFVILDDNDTDCEKEQVKRAEELFKKWCIDNGFDINEKDEDFATLEDHIENGYWESSNYDSISLTWSNINL